MSSNFSRFAFVAAAVGVSLASAVNAGAQTDREMELVEARATVQMATKKLAAAEKKAETLGEANIALGESLAAANAEAKQYRESYQELRLQMEALGVEALLPDSDGIEQRLLKAVSDNRIIEGEKQELAERLVRLSEASMNFLAAGDKPGARKALEDELAAAGEAIRLSEEGAAPRVVAMDEAKVVHLKPEFGLVVLDAGAGSGVRIGMPLSLSRDSRVVATAMVVDVRDKISGAIVQSIAQEGDDVQVGDQVELQTEETL